MKKRYLLAPGPTPIPSKTLLDMAEPIIHHRGPEFSSILGEIREGLKYLFQTRNEVLIFSSSGTGAMEGTISNMLSKGDKALVVNGGKFGERWIDICQAYGVDVEIIDVPWGEAVDPSIVKSILDQNNSIKAVFIQACETSTGVVHPIKEIAEIVKDKENTLVIVDAISALGALDIPTDRWGLDVVVAGSQKALMLPPGLAFASVSNKAWRFVESSNLPKYYFNFKKELMSLSKNQNAYTPAVSLLIGLRESLNQIKEEGLESVFARHEKLAKATRAAMTALELQLYAPTSPSNAVTAVLAPHNINGSDVVKVMREKYGITIAGGQGHAKGKIFRIAHLGYMDQFDVITAVSALEMTLHELGYHAELGKGIRAALEVLKD
ncbi:MAG: alanine--glyoxylate aminotransferase family protein [Deltaproteobacteria bacterium]|jgi:aspartate aminotransferase-like enzyme|nr:MAG: alanine--glyoxylate aminotransferase family protein [Deltaproteobacteria bacterium]